MAVNLYKLHKLIRQRNNRASKSIFTQKMLDISCELMKGAFNGDIPKEELIALAGSMRAIEGVINNIRTSYSKQILEAIENDNYEVSPPVEIAARWREKPYEVGYIYIARSAVRPGLVKLGSTRNLRVRSQKYAIRYGYALEYISTFHTYSPLNCEKNIEREIRKHRVFKNEAGKSNEWYEISPERLVEIVKNHINPVPFEH